MSNPPMPESSALAFAFDAAGFLLFFTGAALRFWATLYIGGRKGHVLVTDGPYAVVRHPIYVGTFLLALSIAAFAKSLLFVAGVGVAFVSYATMTIPAEERYLYGKYAQSYKLYCRATPRYVPSLCRRR